MGGIRWEGRIPNAPLREALLAALSDDLTLSDVCYRMGWVRLGPRRDPGSRTGETAGLKRCLGIEPTRSRNRQTGSRDVTYVQTVEIDKAIAICKAINIDIDELYEGKMPAERVAGLCDECDAPMLKLAPDGLCGLCAEELALFGRIAVAA